MIVYHQADGRIERNAYLVGTGYSGFGDGLNNGDMEAVPDVGPIPRGMWKIIRWDDVHGDKGPCVAVLEPVGHDAHGRSDFLMHGMREGDQHDSSKGCICAGPTIRHVLRDSGDTDLEVV